MVSDATHPVFLKTQMCKFHAAGKCMRGVNCKFAHSQKELAPAPDFSRTKMCPELCRTGRCTRGDACTFAHKTKELRSRGRTCAKGVAPASAPVERCPEGVPQPLQQLSPVQERRAPVVEAPPPPVLLVAQAVPLAMSTVQVVQVMPVPVPCRGFGGCSTVGFAEAPAVARTPASQDMVDLCDTESLDDPFGASCGKEDDDLDLPDGAWSRQSTEEGLLFEAPAEFSRQSTPEAWVPVEEQEGFGDSRIEQAAEDHVDAWPAADTPAAAERKRQALLGTGVGLGYVVKNTFIEFDDEGSPGIPIRRVLSTGGCLSLFV